MSNVLVVEPDFVLAKIYKTALELSGHTLFVADSAQNAVHIADENNLDVVVLELQLIGHSGVEFIYEFRSYSEWQQIPLVLCTFTPPMSLHFSDSMRNQLNITRYLYKPSTTLAKLNRTVSEVTLLSLA